jgi:hypothetical protein
MLLRDRANREVRRAVLTARGALTLVCFALGISTYRMIVQPTAWTALAIVTNIAAVATLLWVSHRLRQYLPPSNTETDR